MTTIIPINPDLVQTKDNVNAYTDYRHLKYGGNYAYNSEWLSRKWMSRGPCEPCYEGSDEEGSNEVEFIEEELDEVELIEEELDKTPQNANLDLLQFWEPEIKANKLCDNAFIDAFLTAYNGHIDIKLSPDIIWNMVCLNLSRYMATYPNLAKKKLFDESSDPTISIIETIATIGTYDWTNFVDIVTAEINKKLTVPIVDDLSTTFTTTKLCDKMLHASTVMDVCKSFLKYRITFTLCGIRNVHMDGTVDDWVLLKTKLINLYNRMAQLEMHDFEKFLRDLEYIFDKFIETREGKPDIDFWNSVITGEYDKIRSGRLVYITGWISKFYYNPEQSDKLYYTEVTVGSLKVPFTIIDEYTNTKIKAYIIGGFYGINIDYDSLIVTPVSSMIVARE